MASEKNHANGTPRTPRINRLKSISENFWLSFKCKSKVRNLFQNKIKNQYELLLALANECAICLCDEMNLFLGWTSLRIEKPNLLGNN